MQDCATRHGAEVASRITIAGVRNRHSEVYANTKSHQEPIHTKGPFAEAGENSM